MDENCLLTCRSFDLLLNEHHVVKQQLESKIQALRILNQELEHCRNERDQLKVVIEHLSLGQNALDRENIKNLATDGLFPDSWKLKGHCDELLIQHLRQIKEKNRLLQNEIRDSKSRLDEAGGDLKTLREVIARQGSSDSNPDVPHGSGSDSFPLSERKRIVKQLETLESRYMLLENDLHSVLDEKEELVKERDMYKNKVDRLNLELNFALKGDEKKIIDVDSILMENRYLQERLKQTQEEKSIYMQTLSKYRSILEKRRNRSALKLGENGSGSVIITHKQVEHMLQNTNITQLPATQATVADLRSLALALFESLNDKNIALSHQKKANKTLGLRLSDLENKISCLKLSGNWETEEEIERAEPEDQVVGPPEHLSSLQVMDPSPSQVEDVDDDIVASLDVDSSNDVEPPSPTNYNNATAAAAVINDIQPSRELGGWGDGRQRHLSCSRIPFTSELDQVSFDDDDDLPPDLQKLVQAAIDDIDKKLSKSYENVS